MIAFYSRQGQFIASVQDEVGGMIVTGDTDFLMQISRGNPTWHYFKTNLMAVDRDEWQSLVIPDGSIPPRTFADALLLAVLQPQVDLQRMKFNFKLFEGFGSVGPLLLESVPEEFEAVIAADSRFRTDIEAKTELLMLRDYHQRLVADSDQWQTYLSNLNDEDLELGDHIYVERLDSPTTILVELGRGLWVQLSKTDFMGTPEFVAFHPFNLMGTDSEIAEELAQVLDSLNAGYVAALELIVDPSNLGDEYDIYGDEDDEDEDEDEDRPFWGSEIVELWEKYATTFSMPTGDLVTALRRHSPQFAEMARMLKNPTPHEHRRIVRAAIQFNPGFGGELGMFDDWAGPTISGETKPHHIALFATYELDGQLWAEVGAHALISGAGDVSTKQSFVDTLSLRNYADLDAKCGLTTSLDSRPIVEAERSKYGVAVKLAQKIQHLVDQFDSIPTDDVEQRNNFSWNDSETDEMLEMLGEKQTRFSTQRYH